ncbi:uncharacterized protein NMK_1828 [Novimethylophilus kurashikiensis]|uniref:Uncharacterized protein n=1 Tax=Novimethylophilus kurashikiensis TaxID=1825523 RepID=A0A2R5FBI8_9PROT|nr:uncharacterized protein NMK_1828 [Novimethylophilus kurashikiensis]
MHKVVKHSSPRPIRVVSQGALWQGKRFPWAFVWVHERELAPIQSDQERLLEMVTALQLPPSFNQDGQRQFHGSPRRKPGSCYPELKNSHQKNS